MTLEEFHNLKVGDYIRSLADVGYYRKVGSIHRVTGRYPSSTAIYYQTLSDTDPNAQNTATSSPSEWEKVPSLLSKLKG